MREIQLQQKQMSEELGRPVAPEETTMFKIVPHVVNKGKSPAEQRLQLTTALSKNIIYGKLVQDNPQEAAKVVNELSKALGIGTEESLAGTNVQQSAIDRALEKFKARNRVAVQQ